MKIKKNAQKIARIESNKWLVVKFVHSQKSWIHITVKDIFSHLISTRVVVLKLHDGMRNKPIPEYGIVYTAMGVSKLGEITLITFIFYHSSLKIHC